MRILIFSIVALFLSSNSFSQEYIKSDFYSNNVPKNPSKSDLGSYGNIPVNYYTGLPEVSINLFTLQSRELSLPVSFAYDASGVKVEDVSGPVGIKWHLNAGGSVQREMRGLPDEDATKGYWKYSNETDYFKNVNNGDWTKWSEKNERDTHPDEFVINTPGRTIKFVFDKNKNAFAIPRQNVNIECTTVNGKIEKFVVTLEDGTKYTFGGVQSSIEETKIESLSFQFRYGESELDIWNNVQRNSKVFYILKNSIPIFKNPNSSKKTIDKFNSKWHLTEILSPTGDKILLSYEKGVADVVFSGKPTVTVVEPVLVNMPYNYTWEGGNFQNVKAYAKFGRTQPNSPPSYIYNSIVPQTSTDLYFKPEDFRVSPGGINSNHTLITKSDVTLLEIASATGSRVVFTKSSRIDLPNSSKYDFIKLYDMNERLVKSFKLNFADIEVTLNSDDYCWISEAVMLSHVSNLSNLNGYKAKDIKNMVGESNVAAGDWRKFIYEGVKEYNYHKLFLESVSEVSGSLERKICEFEYLDRASLKRRNTPMQDKFGFVRSVGYPKAYTISSVATALHVNGENPYEQMSLGVNPANGEEWESDDRPGPLKGMLTKIKYPSKGFVEFSFITGAGPKLHLLKSNDGAGNEYVREIEYPNEGIFTNKPVFVSFQESYVAGTDNWLKYRVISSSPQNDSYTFTNGNLEGNTEVIVYNGRKDNNSGHEIYNFKGPSKYSTESGNLSSQIFATPIDVNESGNLSSITDAFPFPQDYERDYMQSLLEKHQVKTSDNKLVKETVYKYVPNPYNYEPNEVGGFKGGSYILSSGGSGTKPTFLYGNVPVNTMKYRYSRYRIVADWVVLDNKVEKAYDQSLNSPLTNCISTVTKYKYDATHLQVINESVYNEQTPSVEVVSKLKYPTDTDYQQVSLATPSSELSSIIDLNTNHQVASPVEWQKVLKNGDTETLIAAGLTTYKKINSTTPAYIKPSEVYSVNKIMPYSSFVTSKAESDGTLGKDMNMRKVHSYETYQSATGNILQQTKLDGISTTYTWGHNNSLVTGYDVLSGVDLHRYSYTHIPLVGLESLQDMNGVSNSFQYDGFNRLKIEKSGNEIINRYKYHYKDEQDNAVNFSYSTYSSSNMESTIRFSAWGGSEQGTKLIWDFGNGTVNENGTATVLHSYATPGNYTITLAASHPEFTTTATKKVITILPKVTVSVTNTEIARTYTVCTNSGPVTVPFLVTVDVGGTYNYRWEYQVGSQNTVWNVIGTNSNTLNFVFTSSHSPSISVRCIISDNLGNTRFSSSALISHYCITGGGGDGGGESCAPGQFWNPTTQQCETPPPCNEGCFRTAQGDCICP